MIPKPIKRVLLPAYLFMLYLKTAPRYKKIFYRNFLRNGGSRRSILFYPQAPNHGNAMFKVRHLLGYKVLRNPKQTADLMIHWNYGSDVQIDESLRNMAERGRVLNINCTNITKTHTGRVHQELFGYSLEVDPTTYTGKMVRKSNGNAAHDGVVLQGPLADMDPAYVYQRVVKNEPLPGMAEDLRVPVVGNTIPFVYRKLRPMHMRFSAVNSSTELLEPLSVFTEEELTMIVDFCQAHGLDFGELDVLRDYDEGKIYLIDVSPTPNGPPNHISDEDHVEALRRLVMAFEREFVSQSK